MATTVKIGRSCDCPPCTTPNALCGCPVDYFALICLSFPGTPGVGFNGRTFFGLAGVPTFGVWKLNLVTGTCVDTVLALGQSGGSPCGLVVYANCSFGVNATPITPFPPTVTCSPLTIDWGGVVLTTACTLAAPSGPCAGLAVPNAPFLTITGSTAGLNGTYRLLAMPTFVGAATFLPFIPYATDIPLVENFAGWGMYPIPLGASVVGGTCILWATVDLAGTVNLGVTRNSDGHFVGGVGGSVSSCSPFVVSGTVHLTGSDATVPGFGETVTISVTA